MEAALLGSVVERLEALPDPRSEVNRLHPLAEVVVIAVCGVIAGADGPTSIHRWAEAKADWLGGLLRLPHGVPSRDCLRRVLSLLEPEAFGRVFGEWAATCFSESSAAGHVAIDGKTLRRSVDKKHALGPLHVVSAWASDAGLSLGQLATDEKSNEITVIPELLDAIDVKDAVVTIDAMGCQKEIAAEITGSGSDYVLTLKGNQKKLHAAVAEHFNSLHEVDDFTERGCLRRRTKAKGHGRVEQRYYYQSPLPEDLKPLAREWSGLRTIGQVISITERDGKECSEVRYYLSSLEPGVKRFAHAVRSHWRIENSLHWVLGVTFDEDRSRARDRRLADNLAWLRRLANGLLKRHPSRYSIKGKRQIAGWSNDFLEEVLGIATS